MTRTISIDRGKPLAEEPRTGHNRWHPDIEPIAEVGEGEDVTLETRDACDGHLTPRSTVADLATLPVGAIHPLTGPVAVKGARPGDLLEIEFREIVPQPWAFSGIIPGLGYLRDVMTTPYLVHWNIADGWATSPQLPRVRISGRLVHGRVRRGALARPGGGVDAPRGRRRGARRDGAAARTPAARCRVGGMRRRTASARCRRARTGATST